MIFDQSAMWGASFYEGMEHNPNHAFVVATYATFKRVVLRQWEELRSSGITFIASLDDPYPNSKTMRADVEDNCRLMVYADNGATLPDDHPMKQKVDAGVEGFTVFNDIFRGVHDVMGHVVSGGEFGPKGENAAWLAHRDTMPKLALPALWCETRGQNLWTNFWADHAKMPMPERPFGEQKVGPVPMYLA